MRNLLLVFALLFIGNVFAESQVKNAKGTQNAAPSETRGTDQSPIVVKILPSHDSEKETAAQQKEREEKANLDRKLVDLTGDLAKYTADLAIFTMALGGIGILQLLVFGYQSVQLKRTVDSTEMMHRPVLIPMILGLENLHSLEPIKQETTFDSRIFFVFENYGKTPGIIREVRANLFLTDLDEFPEVSYERLPVHDYPRIIPADTKGEAARVAAVDLVNQFTLTPAAFQELLAEASTGKYKRFTLIGQVTYDDFFETRHVRRFCFKLRRMGVGPYFATPRGGSTFNRVESYKAPTKNDPLAA